MMKTYFLLVVLTLAMLNSPAACLADNSLITDIDLINGTAEASGTVIRVITDQEASAFRMSDASLKQAVGNYFGKIPNYAYLNSVTPGGDLYNTFNWPEVKTTLQAAGARIFRSTPEPVIIQTATYVNNENAPSVQHIKIYDIVSNTQEHIWSNDDDFRISQNVRYNFVIPGQPPLSYICPWGQNHGKNQQVPVGSEEGVDVTLAPGESVVAQLTAIRGTATVTVTYHASLRGVVALKYSPAYKNQNFWALDIAKVMETANLPLGKDITETINLTYYEDAKVEIRDEKGTVKRTFPIIIKH